jgi:hypothetical protein
MDDAREMFLRIALGRARAYRRGLLSALFAFRGNPSGWTSAVKLREAVKDAAWDDPEQEHDNYWICLLRDLCIKGLIEERQKKRNRKEPFRLKHLKYRLLSRGLSLCLESVAPDPDIEDDRAIVANP